MPDTTAPRRLTLKPGVIVLLSTRVDGGVHYDRRVIEDYTDGENAHVQRSETTRTIDDAAEHATAQKVRQQARSLIVSACQRTAFGLICVPEREPALADKLAEAQRIVAAFNTESRATTVRLGVLTVRIASTDEEAAKAVLGDVRDLLADMERAVRAADPVAIRDAANRARQTAAVLARDDQREAVSAAIAQARQAAREVTRRIEVAGENAEEVVRSISTKAISQARFALLDLGDDGAQDGPTAPSQEVA